MEGKKVLHKTHIMFK